MDGNERMAIEWVCQRLSAEYVRHADFQDFEAFARLFAPDGVLELFGTQRKGRDEIRQHFRDRPRMVTRHICANHCIDPVDSDRADGIVYLVLYRLAGDHTEDDGPIPMDRPTLIGHYEDQYVRTDEGWKFARRRLHVRFERQS